jgi:RNA polymerase sigma factor (sigma-70 family)
MAHAQLGSVVQHLRQLATSRPVDRLSDHRLLELFASNHDQSAFTALVERHGRLVLSVCRHVLRHTQDAEDAFQATFLILARKARSIRKRAALASWLHGVAYRMAVKAKRTAARRRAHEHQAGLAARSNAAPDLSWHEVQAMLDDEIQRLPEMYRAPFILCGVDGQSRVHAARQLGIKEGTLSSRLATARERLQKRLQARGLALSAVLAGTALTRTTVSAALVRSTVLTSSMYIAKAVTGGTLASPAVTLAHGALKTMFLSKVKAGLSVALALGMLGTSAGLALRGGWSMGHACAAPVKVNTPTTAGPNVFCDVTAESGIHFTYRNGEEAGHCALLEALGGGVAVLDYDNDGLMDIFIAGGGCFAGPDNKEIRGHPCKLFKNVGQGRFQDVTRDVGLDGPSFYSHGAAVVDYDRDGWPDLLVTGWGRLALYHNEPDGKGGRRFVDVTERAGLPVGLWTTSAAFADLDGDGFPDLYVCQYVDWSFANHPEVFGSGAKRDICPPKLFRGLPHKLFRNNGNGTFTEVSQEAGLRSGVDGAGLGVVIADLDGDGKPDIYVANDSRGNFLYHNQCVPGEFSFVEVGKDAGVALDDQGVSNSSMGIAIGDIDGSGRPSLFVTHYENESHALYLNRSRAGQPLFRFQSAPSGITAIGQRFVGWGTAFLDYDGDGCLDLLIANGHTLKAPPGRARRCQKPVLLRSLGNGTYVDVTALGGAYFQTEHNARGVALVDINNDGRLDVIISHVNEPVVVLRNQAAPTGHWIGFELAGKDRRDVVGAKVILETDTRTQTSFAHSGGSYASSSDRRHLFGLGPAEKVQRIRVAWPGGGEQRWDGLAVNRYWRLREGEGAEELKRQR